MSKYFLGIGVSGKDFDRKALESILQLLHKLAILSLASLATIDKKRNHPLIIALSHELDVPILWFSAIELETQTVRLANPCQQLYDRLGCHSVAEAAALVAGGQQAQLTLPKIKICGKVTIALTQQIDI